MIMLNSNNQLHWTQVIFSCPLKLLSAFGLCMAMTTFPAMANSLGTGSFARCDLAISEVSQRTQNKYDPLSYHDYLQPVQLKIRNVGSKKCEGSIRFEIGSGNGTLRGASGESLNYLLLGEHSLNKVLFNPQRQSQIQFSLNLKAGRSVQFSPHLYIPRGQGVISGHYESQIDAVYEERSGTLQKRIPFHFGAHVRASVQANFVGVDRLAGNGRHGSINLGELSPGLRRTFGLQLRSNSDVDVSISSENQGELAHKSRHGSGIAYSLRIEGNQIDLSSKGEIVLPADLSRNGLTNTIEVELDDYDKAPAGRYRDLIHVRVSAR